MGELGRCFAELQEAQEQLRAKTFSADKRKEWMEKNGHELTFIRDLIAEHMGVEYANSIMARAYGADWGAALKQHKDGE